MMRSPAPCPAGAASEAGVALPDQPLVYNPYDYALHDDPYPTYARMREEVPCMSAPCRRCRSTL
ncbi:hypothetical protein Pta02_61080 [Planobispora takensis]|uniref:Uncharacterized protein n=1 Tax=Planobispora takensis TaxID=1367882 RepID=A0A8J3T3A2_9ACTN|nr:hypothetical protein Pta02_61080 [Planobispora takensis]